TPCRPRASRRPRLRRATRKTAPDLSGARWPACYVRRPTTAPTRSSPIGSPSSLGRDRPGRLSSGRGRPLRWPAIRKWHRRRTRSRPAHESDGTVMRVPDSSAVLECNGGSPPIDPDVLRRFRERVAAERAELQVEATPPPPDPWPPVAP